MKTTLAIKNLSGGRFSLDHRLAAYAAAAGAVGLTLASDAEAVIVGNSTVQPFGINGDVNIDFNSDGQTDFQIDHDRVNVGGTDLDYLQIDKNDVSSAAMPLPINDAATFPPGMTTPNDAQQAKYVTTVKGAYSSALTAGTSIGPASFLDFQEGVNFDGTGRTIRANRLIDEDHTQIDQVIGGKTPAQVQVPLGTPNFLGLGGQVRYLGVQAELNNVSPGNFGWIGIRIDNEGDATGAVVGYAYETTPGVAIPAGVVPEPGSMAMAAIGGLTLLGAALRRRRGKRLG